MRIKSVTLFFPNSEDGSIVSYEVGKNEVTQIIQSEYSPEPYCCKYFFEIYQEDKIIARMDHFSLIEYFKD